MNEQQLQDKQIVQLLRNINILNKIDRSHIRSKYFMELSKEQLVAIANSPFLTEELKEYAVMELRTFSVNKGGI